MNSPRKLENESVSREIETLTGEMQDLLKQKDLCLRRKKDLMAAEDPGRGIYYHQQIHALQMEYLRLDVEAETKRKKTNRLRLGFEHTEER